jgi:hypothetical protein
MKSFLIVAAVSVLAFAIQAHGADPVEENEPDRYAMSAPLDDHAGGAQPNAAAMNSTKARTRADSCSRGG